MSPHVGNFVQDLVEMAKATEMLPQVQAENERLIRDNAEMADKVAAREETILRLKADIERLNEAVREAEVSRDDAELRFLEADDVANRVHRKVADVEAVLRSMAADLEGLKPKLLEPPQAEPQDQSEPLPQVPPANTSDTPNDAGPVPATPEAAGSTGTEGSGVEQARGEGVSVTPDPIVAPVVESPHTDAGVTSPGPYVGKLYIRVPGWISRENWLAGGGTDETYDWRIGSPIPEGVSDPDFDPHSRAA